MYLLFFLFWSWSFLGVGLGPRAWPRMPYIPFVRAKTSFGKGLAISDAMISTVFSLYSGMFTPEAAWLLQIIFS